MKTTERTEAQRLFFQTNYTKTQIAEMLGVSRRTLSLWSHHGNWDKLRKSSRTLPAIVAEKCYHLVDEYTSGLLADKYVAQNINFRHAQTIHLLATSIKKLKNGSTVNEAMQTFNLFLGGLEHRHPDLAAQVAPEVDEFIRLTAGAKSTDHLTSPFADDGTIPFSQEDFNEQYKNEQENDELNQAFEEFMQQNESANPSATSCQNSAQSTSPSQACCEPAELAKDGKGPQEDDTEDFSQPDNVYPPGPTPVRNPSHSIFPNDETGDTILSKPNIDPTLQSIIEENNFTKNLNQSAMQKQPPILELERTVSPHSTLAEREKATQNAHSASPSPCLSRYISGGRAGEGLHTAHTPPPLSGLSKGRTIPLHSTHIIDEVPNSTSTKSIIYPHSPEAIFPLPDDIIVTRNALAHSGLPEERKKLIIDHVMAKEGDRYILREKGRRIAAALEAEGFAPYRGPRPMPPSELARFNEVLVRVAETFEKDVAIYKAQLAAAGLKYPFLQLSPGELSELDQYHKTDKSLQDLDPIWFSDEEEESTPEPVSEIETHSHKPVHVSSYL